MTSSTKFLETIWQGQQGLAQVVEKDFSQREHCDPAEAIAQWDRYAYFAPLLRAYKALGKRAVAPTGNVLWVDIDSRHAPAQIEEVLVQRGVVPTFIVDSGNKGYWVFLKLDRLIPKQEIERMNKAFSRLLDGSDKGAWNCDRLARIPGSIHNESGRTVIVVEATGVIHDPQTLKWVRQEADARALDRGADKDEEPQYYEPAGTSFPLPKLSPEHWQYIDEHPRCGERYDRSSEEQAIFTALVLQRFTDDEIIAFADHHKLARHQQERARLGDYRWTLRSIRSARSYAERQQLTPSRSTPMCTESVRYQHVDRHAALTHIDGRTAAEITGSIQAELGGSERTIRRIFRQYESAGLIEGLPEGRHVRYRRTARGEEIVASRFRLMLRLPPVRELRTRRRYA